MAAPIPSSGTTPAATQKEAAVNSSTKFMLTRMEQSWGKTHIPPTIRYFVKEIADNRDLKQVQEKITNLKEDRDSIFRVRAELDTLILSLEKSTLKPDLRNLLLLRAKDLLGVIDQATKIDERFSTLEKGLATLEEQRLKIKQERYKAIETASNPREKAAQLLQAEKTTQTEKSNQQPTLEEYKDNVTQAIKLFRLLHKKIGEEYTYLRDSTPGNLGMKTFQALSTPVTPSIDQQSATKMSGARGG